jgi:hypothetical protein
MNQDGLYERAGSGRDSTNPWHGRFRAGIICLVLWVFSRGYLSEDSQTDVLIRTATAYANSLIFLSAFFRGRSRFGRDVALDQVTRKIRRAVVVSGVLGTLSLVAVLAAWGWFLRADDPAIRLVMETFLPSETLFNATAFGVAQLSIAYGLWSSRNWGRWGALLTGVHLCASSFTGLLIASWMWSILNKKSVVDAFTVQRGGEGTRVVKPEESVA